MAETTTPNLLLTTPGLPCWLHHVEGQPETRGFWGITSGFGTAVPLTMDIEDLHVRFAIGASAPGSIMPVIPGVRFLFRAQASLPSMTPPSSLGICLGAWTAHILSAPRRRNPIVQWTLATLRLRQQLLATMPPEQALKTPFLPPSVASQFFEIHTADRCVRDSSFLEMDAVWACLDSLVTPLEKAIYLTPHPTHPNLFQARTQFLEETHEDDDDATDYEDDNDLF